MIWRGQCWAPLRLQDDSVCSLSCKSYFPFSSEGLIDACHLVLGFTREPIPLPPPNNTHQCRPPLHLACGKALVQPATVSEGWWGANGTVHVVKQARGNNCKSSRLYLHLLVKAGNGCATVWHPLQAAGRVQKHMARFGPTARLACGCWGAGPGSMVAVCGRSAGPEAGHSSTTVPAVVPLHELATAGRSVASVLLWTVARMLGLVMGEVSKQCLCCQ